MFNDEKQHTCKQSNNVLSTEDCIIVTIMIIGLVLPIILFGVSKIYQIYFPPVLFSILLSMAVASMLYRFLGGLHDATFALGALKLTGSAAVFVAMTFWSNTQISQQMNNKNNLTDLYGEIAKLNRMLAEKENDIMESKKTISDSVKNAEAYKEKNDKLQKLFDGLTQGDTIIDIVNDLDPESELAQKLIFLQLKNKGPWGQFSKTKHLKVSVVDYLPKGDAASCGEYFGKLLEFTSDLKGENQLTQGYRSVPIRINRWISKGEDCKNNYDYDVQLNCHDAKQIFTDSVIECGKNNDVKWKIPAQFLPITAVTVIEKARQLFIK